MSKRKSIQQQLQSKIHQQYKDGYGTSRHEEKIARGTYAIHDKIYSQNSINQHLIGVKNFAKWCKAEHPEIRKIEEINREIMSEYINHLDSKEYSGKTIDSYVAAVNRVQVAEGHWDKSITAKGLGFDLDYTKRHNIDSTEEQLKHDRESIEKHPEVYDYGKAFGLRRSELVGNNSRHTYASNKSLYEHNGKLYNVSIGKGGLLRMTECLKKYEDTIRERYSEDIQQLPQWMAGVDRFTSEESKRFYQEQFKGAERYFDTMDRSCRIHVPCRQYYAMEKLEEIKEEHRFEHGRELEVNGVIMKEPEALFISKQLGHNRVEILRDYVGRQTEFA